ncbi:hypothetical protein Zm00014a_011740 [Zea mays]|uniref:Uncharacterized protein n=2 Tax=Zea mays TaxID=4577 RepID=B6SUY3_MAIZE|nr:uncharacterized protein LOC100275534 precursor [Zea mays]ACG28666.1 hypothetical protein [Zea mays]AQK52939.1 hypothetical protein ZEAMMB73_Zm00001d050705 [Zea mays]PWZ26286.1 hypothetical protein Zm00014a_011740 [Zea mays]|eukprot:NP_001143063.1 uncharacterized protein LOC100275534 precursor [Zea mays]
MGAATTLPGNAGPVRCSRTFLALLLCFQLLHTSLALKLHGVGGYEEKKVPLAVIVPDPSPELSGLSPAPLAAPAPVHGGGDVRPRLPTERWRRDRGEVRRAAHPPAAPAAAPEPTAAPSAGPARAPTAGAPAPGSGDGGAAFIKSSPAVPVPRGVTDTDTVLPMPAPGETRQEVGGANSVGAACVMPLLLGLMAMLMLSFGI